MSKLSSRQRAHLRSLAHPLKPILQVGADGVSEAFLVSLDEAFRNRELLKIRVLNTASVDLREATEALRAARPEVHVVQTIGRVAALYRTHPEKPEIVLP
jgi:RNA-binding protein